MAALTQTRQKHPEREIDSKGWRVFYLSRAKKLLVQDIQDEKHLEMSWEALYYTRDEYWDADEGGWSLKDFK
eukprot:scaffold32669_cov137-Amphora_coffeaeformis.AAC.1